MENCKAEKRPELDSLIDEIYSNIGRIADLKGSLISRVNKLDGQEYPHSKITDNAKSKAPSCINEHLVEIKQQLANIGDELTTINQRFVSQIG